MYNLRYHIASLVSVFLALALGLVLGGLIVQRGTFGSGTEGLIEGLQQEFISLREANDALENENEQLTALTTAFVDGWVAERLSGETVVLVTGAGRQDGLEAARDAVESAGGTAAIVTVLVPGFGLEDPEKRSAVETMVAGSDDAETGIATSLAAEWASADQDRPITDGLVELGILSIEGLPEQSGAGGMLVIAAPEGQSDSAAIALAREFQNLELPSAAAQTPQTDTGVAAAAYEEGVSAFDTLGTEIGRYTAVSLLTGGEPGFYGTSAAATALFPPLPESPQSVAPLEGESQQGQ
jgi:hypothetical protein